MTVGSGVYPSLTLGIAGLVIGYLPADVTTLAVYRLKG